MRRFAITRGSYASQGQHRRAAPSFTNNTAESTRTAARLTFQQTKRSASLSSVLTNVETSRAVGARVRVTAHHFQGRRPSLARSRGCARRCFARRNASSLVQFDVGACGRQTGHARKSDWKRQSFFLFRFTQHVRFCGSYCMRWCAPSAPSVMSLHNSSRALKPCLSCEDFNTMLSPGRSSARSPSWWLSASIIATTE